MRGIDGNFYGVTNERGHPPGPGPDGGHPLGTVTWGGDGHLYGTTFVGGSTGKGVAFQVL